MSLPKLKIRISKTFLFIILPLFFSTLSTSIEAKKELTIEKLHSLCVKEQTAAVLIASNNEDRHQDVANRMTVFCDCVMDQSIGTLAEATKEKEIRASAVNILAGYMILRAQPGWLETVHGACFRKINVQEKKIL